MDFLQERDNTTDTESSYGHCRCCLEEGYHRNITKAYLSSGSKEIYADILLDCFNVFLSTHTNLSTLICSDCVAQLRAARDFKALVLRTEEQLMEELQKCDNEQMVLVNVPIPKETLGTTVGFKIEVNDFGNFTETKQDAESDECAQEVTIALNDDSNSDTQISWNDSDSSDILNQDTVKQEFSSTVSVKEEITSNGECSEEESSKYNMCEGKHISGKSLERLLQTDTEKLKGNLKTVPNDQLNDDLNEPFTKKKRIQTTKYKEKDKLDIDRLKNPYTIERLTHATNITAILEYSNVTAFKSKFQRAYPCFYCEKLFEDFEELKKHQKSDHTKENVSQSVLKKYRVGRPDGVVVYADISDLQCTICSKSIQSLNDLKKHLTEVHGKKMYLELSDRVIPFKVKENSFQCQLCGNLYETFGAIERHMNTHYRNYVCEECDSGFVSKQRLRIHGYHMHSRRTKQYPCEVCQKQFPSQQKRKIHVETVHENVKKYKCNRCPERFNEYFRRHKHMVLVHGVAPLEYKCNICEKSFERPYALSIHMRTHIQQKDIYCEICPYRCFTNVELRHHMIKHNGKRIHECSVCKKSYAREKTLKEHMRIHTNDRRYVCPVCGQAFIQNCSLKSHIRSHHKDYGLT